jgi:hypothetical protein
MVESIDVAKGGNSGDNWTIDSLPTQIDITLIIKDLYPTMMQSMVKGSSSVLFQNNTGMIEYLSVMSGMQMHGLHFLDNLKTALAMLGGQVVNIPSAIKDAAAQKVYKGLRDVTTKWFRDI